MKIGNHITELKKRFGLSHKELARRTQIKGSHLSFMEYDRVSPTLETLEKIYGAVGLRFYIKVVPTWKPRWYSPDDPDNRPPNKVMIIANRGGGKTVAGLYDEYRNVYVDLRVIDISVKRWSPIDIAADFVDIDLAWNYVRRNIVPEMGEEIVVSYQIQRINFVTVARYGESGFWFSGRGYMYSEDVYAWMRLPEPPMEYRE